MGAVARTRDVSRYEQQRAPLRLATSSSVHAQKRLQVRRDPGGRMLLLFAACTLFCALLFKLSIRIAIVQEAYAIENLREENLTQDRELRRLRLTYESILNPEELRARAEGRLGMRPIMPQQIRYLGEKGVQ